MKSLLVWLLCGAVTLPLLGDCSFPLWERRSSIDAAAEFIGSADFNGDNHPDVLGSSATSVFFALNDQTGKLLPASQIYSGAIASPALSDDLNGDAATDVVFASGGTLVVLPGNGDGTFGTAIVSPVAVAPVMLRIARIGPDHLPDIAALDAAGGIRIYANDGNARFVEMSRVDPGAGANGIAIADFDADGANDLVVSYEAPSSGLNLYPGTPTGVLGQPVPVRGTSGTSGVHAVELTNDGLPDLVLYKKYARTLVTMRNLGARAFNDPLQYGTTRFFGQVAAGELTGDSFNDLAIVLDLCQLWTASGTGLGTLEWMGSTSSETGFCGVTLDGSVAIADFDRDGRNDVAVALVRDGGRASIDIHRNVCGDSIVKVTAPALISLGQPANVTVLVRPPETAQWAASATGEIAIRKGESVVARGLLQSNAKLEIPDLPVGEHSLVAEYSGDAQFEPNVSAPFTIRVTAATTTTTITVDPPHEYGHSAAITVRVSSSTETIPYGALRLDVKPGGGGTSGTAPVLHHYGRSTLGEHTLVATFAGDADHPPSSASLTYENVRQTPKVSLSTYARVAGAAFDLEVRLDPRYYVSEWPTGSVRLRLGGFDESGSLALYARTMFTIPALAPGRHQLRVTYPGDERFAPIDTQFDFIAFGASGLPLDARGTAEGVRVTWRPTNDAIRVSRKLPAQPWSLAAGTCCVYGGWLDSYPGMEQVYVYRMSPAYEPAVSDADIAMRIAFTDDPLMPGRAIRAVHMQEIVRAANIVRTASGLPPLDGSQVLKGTVLSASLMNTLRQAINEARVTLGAVPFAFTRTIAAGVAIHANDMQELREAVR